MKHEPSKLRQEPSQQANHDNPEQFPTEERHMLDRFDEEQTVDPIPLEDLNMEQQEEQNKDATKANSSTEEKYRADYRKR